MEDMMDPRGFTINSFTRTSINRTEICVVHCFCAASHEEAVIDLLTTDGFPPVSSTGGRIHVRNFSLNTQGKTVTYEFCAHIVSNSNCSGVCSSC